VGRVGTGGEHEKKDNQNTIQQTESDIIHELNIGRKYKKIQLKI